MKDFRKCVFAISVSMFAFSTARGNTSSLEGKIHSSADRRITDIEKRVIDVQDMLSLYDMGGMTYDGLSVSPDGKYLAFQIRRANLEENSYEVGWYVLDLARRTEPPIRVGGAGDPLLFRRKVGHRINGAWESTDPVWSPDSKWIAYRRMDGESVQVWRSSIDGGINERLTESEASVDAFYWSKDGKQIWFETKATPQEQAEYLRSKWENGMWAGAENYQPTLATYRMIPYEVTSGQPRLWALNLSSNQVRQASKSEVQSHFESNLVSLHPVFRRADRSVRVPGRPLSRSVTASYDGENIAWLESQVKAIQQNTQIHVRLGSAKGADISCEFEECFGEIRKLWWSRDGREVVFSRAEDPNLGRNVIYAWHIDKNVVRKIYTEDSHHLSACSSTGYSLFCFSDDAASPRTIVEVLFEDGSVTELFDPNPQFDQILIGEVELIDWTNALGNETFGWLIKPVFYEKNKRYPLVIVQYRAKDCFKGGTGAEYPSHLFAAEGFVVLCLDHPVSRPAETGGSDPYWKKRGVLSAFESAIDLLDKRGLIDTTRVGITGLSGGVDAISYVLSRSNQFGAAIGASLGWSPIGYYSASTSAKAFARKTGFGRPGTTDDKYWSAMSLGMNVGKVQTPILIQVSDDEAPGSMFNYVTLKESRKPVDMYVFADEYHIKWHPRNRKAVAVRAVDWMRFWLKGEEDSDPAKAEQYERWRSLCEQHVVGLQSSEDPELQQRADNQPCSATIH